MEHDTQILTEALQRELCSRKDALLSSSSNLLETRSHCKGEWQEDHNSAFLRALQGGGAFHRGCNHPRNTVSLMAASYVHDRLSPSDSPFTSSCVNSDTTIAAGDCADTKSLLSSAKTKTTGFPIQNSEELKLFPLACTIPGYGTSVAAGAPPIKVEDTTTAFTTGKGAISWGKTASPSLSAEASAGAGTARVSKRRSRASNKAPITVLSADTTNFKAMVQKLTGIPTSPSMQQARYNFWTAPSAVSVLKPQPSRSPQSIQGLPTLDTSAFLLLDGASSLSQTSRHVKSDSLLQGFSGFPFLQSSQPQDNFPFHSNLAGEFGLNLGGQLMDPSSFLSASSYDHLRELLPSLMDSSKQGTSDSARVTMPMLWDAIGNGRVREKSSVHGDSRKQASLPGMSGEKTGMEMGQAAILDVLQLGHEKLDLDFSSKTLHTVDSWLASDGSLANHSPKVELAHNA